MKLNEQHLFFCAATENQRLNFLQILNFP